MEEMKKKMCRKGSINELDFKKEKKNLKIFF